MPVPSVPAARACDLAVVEGELACRGSPALLVTLAGDHNDVAARADSSARSMAGAGRVDVELGISGNF